MALNTLKKDQPLRLEVFLQFESGLATRKVLTRIRVKIISRKHQTRSETENSIRLDELK